MKQPPTVPVIDLARYMGTWHELARSQPELEWEAMCVGAKAHYRLNKHSVAVKNTCIMEDGESFAMTATAHPTDRPGVLDITFHGPYGRSGQYWIHWTDYNYAIVGSPQGHAWILSRIQTPPEDVLENLILTGREFGYHFAH